MMEAARTSETSVNFDVTTRHYIPEESKLHTRRRENLKPHRKREKTSEAIFDMPLEKPKREGTLFPNLQFFCCKKQLPGGLPLWKLP
jgi:hypothetical protein